MDKVKIAAAPPLFPHPVVLVGADVDGQADFAAVAWISVAAGTPPSLVIALNRTRHSLKGIRQNQVFSVNIPSTALVRETDCGLISGAKTDKVKDCNFKVFYGEVAHAPFIEQCPVNVSCAAGHFVEMGSHYLVAGPIKEMLVSGDCLTGGKPDAAKIDPIVYMGHPAGSYHNVGQFVAEAFRVGREIKDIKDKD